MDKSVCLLADNVWNYVFAIKRSQKLFKLLPLYMYIFLTLAVEVLSYLQKIFCRDACSFLTNIFCYLQATPKENIQGLRLDEYAGLTALQITLSPKTSDKACIYIHAVWAVDVSCINQSCSLSSFVNQKCARIICTYILQLTFSIKTLPTICFAPTEHQTPIFTGWNMTLWVGCTFCELQQ